MIKWIPICNSLKTILDKSIRRFAISLRFWMIYSHRMLCWSGSRILAKKKDNTDKMSRHMLKLRQGHPSKLKKWKHLSLMFNDARTGLTTGLYHTTIQWRQWTKLMSKARHPSSSSVKHVAVRAVRGCSQPRRDGNRRKMKGYLNLMECQNLNCRCNRECSISSFQLSSSYLELSSF